MTIAGQGLRHYSDFGCPASWYRVAWSSDVRPGDVLPLAYFGQDLVLYRTVDGNAVVLDAFCQHLGAHLGHGGVVDNDCIVCPFHGWSWQPDGKNAAIPYAPRPVRRAIKSWHVRELNGIIWVWYDPNAGEPAFDLVNIPELDDGTYTPIDDEEIRSVWTNVRVHPLQSVENTGDPAHIRFIHGAGVIPAVDAFHADGATFSSFMRYVWGADKESTWLTPDGPVEGTLHAESTGLGLIVTRYSGIWPTIQLTGCTPIDAARSDYYTAVAVKTGADNQFRTRIAKHFFIAVEADFPIWENMMFLEHPPLPPLESRVMRDIRSWSKQFFDVTATV